MPPRAPSRVPARVAGRARLLVAASAVLALAACGDDGPATPDEIAPLARAAGIAPELVYVTEIDGFSLQGQSVGVSGDDGLSAAHWQSGRTVVLTTGRTADPAAPACADLADGAGGLRCVVARGAVRVLLQGEGVDAATLRKAGEAVRVPTSDELDKLFADVPKGAPVQRGDLPSNGDGAPIDPAGPGG